MGKIVRRRRRQYPRRQWHRVTAKDPRMVLEIEPIYCRRSLLQHGRISTVRQTQLLPRIPTNTDRLLRRKQVVASPI